MTYYYFTMLNDIFYPKKNTDTYIDADKQLIPFNLNYVKRHLEKKPQDITLDYITNNLFGMFY